MDDYRIGDFEREEAVLLLAQHHSDGRLTLDEYDERVEEVMAAKTRGDLDRIFIDLPTKSSPLPEKPTSSAPTNQNSYPNLVFRPWPGYRLHRSSERLPSQENNSLNQPTSTSHSSYWHWLLFGVGAFCFLGFLYSHMMTWLLILLILCVLRKPLFRTKPKPATPISATYAQDELRRLVRAGEKRKAIKLFQEVYGASAIEATMAVEELTRRELGL